MQIFNADNLSFIMLGFAKTIEISFFAIIFSIVFGTVLAMVCAGVYRLHLGGYGRDYPWWI